MPDPALPEVVHFDNHDPALDEDTVWTAYADARGRCPVTRSDAHGGFWMVTGHDEVKAATRDHQTFSSASGHLIPMIGSTRSIPIDCDPPIHKAYRALMTPPLSRERIEAMRPVVREFVTGQLATAAGAGGFDGVEALALPLPLMVLRELLGLSGDAAAQLRPLTESMWKRVSTESLGTARAELFDLMLSEIDRSEGSGTYIGELMDQEVEGRPVTRDEAKRLLAMFAIAGHETTLHAIGNLLFDLASDRGLQERVRADRSLVPALVEESLRLKAPAHLFGRTVTADAELGGMTLHAGDKVMLVYAAANRDPGRFPDPDAFDVDRPRRQHFSFGWGIHQCVGASLVRMEMQVIVDALCDLPCLALDGEPEFSGLEGGHHMGPRRLPLRFQ